MRIRLTDTERTLIEDFLYVEQNDQPVNYDPDERKLIFNALEVLKIYLESN